MLSLEDNIASFIGGRGVSSCEAFIYGSAFFHIGNYYAQISSCWGKFYNNTLYRTRFGGTSNWDAFNIMFPLIDSGEACLTYGLTGTFERFFIGETTRVVYCYSNKSINVKDVLIKKITEQFGRMLDVTTDSHFLNFNSPSWRIMIPSLLFSTRVEYLASD